MERATIVGGVGQKVADVLVTVAFCEECPGFSGGAITTITTLSTADGSDGYEIPLACAGTLFAPEGSVRLDSQALHVTLTAYLELVPQLVRFGHLSAIARNSSTVHGPANGILHGSHKAALGPAMSGD